MQGCTNIAVAGARERGRAGCTNIAVAGAGERVFYIARCALRGAIQGV
ncbi:hypothetical protein MNBD_GAMMA11-2451, partial [hydrothermal vent metagenome]